MSFISDTSRKFQIVWDTGRRCTYACSYCPPHRNNKTSRLVELPEFIETMDFVDEYYSFYNDFRTEQLFPSISFTGGEPTIHPDFFDFCVYIKETYGTKYKVNLTTNGAFGQKMRDKIKDCLDGGTISYHPESDEKQKELVEETIFQLGRRMSVNVMFSKYHFQECVDLCDRLKKGGIRFAPRRIGDDGDNIDSVLLGYTHIYSDEQEAWFNNFHGVKEANKGRSCCGGRCVITEKGDTKFMPSTNFQGWSCGVNWYFLYLNQESRDVFHHQTCQVDMNGDIGPIGNLDNTDEIFDMLTDKFYIKRELPVIKCPKTFCGCGLCADKASTFEEYVDIQKDKIDNISFTDMDIKNPKQINPLKKRLEAMDAPSET